MAIRMGLSMPLAATPEDLEALIAELEQDGFPVERAVYDLELREDELLIEKRRESYVEIVSQEGITLPSDTYLLVRVHGRQILLDCNFVEFTKSERTPVRYTTRIYSREKSP